MSRFRDFDAARAERASEPLEFKLGGELFTASGDMPAGLLLDAAASMHDPNAQGDVFQALFNGIVAEEDHERFAAAVRRVDMQTVVDLVEWIMEEVTGRPLPSASPSLAQLSTNGSPSKVASPPLAWSPST